MVSHQKQDKPSRLAATSQDKRTLVRVGPIGVDSIESVIASIGFCRPEHVFRHVVEVIPEEIFDDRKVRRQCAVKRDTHMAARKGKVGVYRIGGFAPRNFRRSMGGLY